MRQQSSFSHYGWAILIAIAAYCAAGAAKAGDVDKDVILARKTLMNSVMDAKDRIDASVAQQAFDLRTVNRAADAIAVLMGAFPHLFPQGSNQWKENVDLDPATDTIASPDIWVSYGDFYRRAAATATTAYELSRAETADEVRRLNRALGNACDTCHAMYLKE
jgi:cytochrome c556